MQPTQTILLCEEDAAVRVFLAENLTADGYHVLAVEHRTSALEQLERAQPDLVVCDVNGETLDLLDAVRHADGLAVADRSRRPADRADGARRRARARALPRARRRRRLR